MGGLLLVSISADVTLLPSATSTEIFTLMYLVPEPLIVSVYSSIVTSLGVAVPRV